MALDPKEVLKKNKLLVGLYAGALVAIALWVFLVPVSAKADFQKLKGKLRSQQRALRTYAKAARAEGKTPAGEEVIFTQGDLETLEKQRGVHQEQLLSCIDQLLEKDEKLDRWFERWEKMEPGEMPPDAQFQATLQSQWNDLRRKFEDIAGQGAQSQVGEMPSPRPADVAQQKFWITEAVLEACRRGKIRRVVERLSIKGAKGAEDDLAMRIPVSLKVLMSFRDVPILIREFLASPIPMKVVAVRVERHPFSIKRPEVKLDINQDPKTIFEETFYQLTFPTGEVFEGTEADYVAEPPLRVSLELEVLDFNEAALQQMRSQYGGGGEGAAPAVPAAPGGPGTPR